MQACQGIVDSEKEEFLPGSLPHHDDETQQRTAHQYQVAGHPPHGQRHRRVFEPGLDPEVNAIQQAQHQLLFQKEEAEGRRDSEQPVSRLTDDHF